LQYYAQELCGFFSELFAHSTFVTESMSIKELHILLVTSICRFEVDPEFAHKFWALCIQCDLLYNQQLSE